MSLIVKVVMPFLATEVLSMPRGSNWQNTPLAADINPRVPVRSALCVGILMLHSWNIKAATPQGRSY